MQLPLLPLPPQTECQQKGYAKSNGWHGPETWLCPQHERCLIVLLRLLVRLPMHLTLLDRRTHWE